MAWKLGNRWVSSLVSACAVGSLLTFGSIAGTAPAAATTLELWLGGILTTATPGTPYRKWVDEQLDRFKKIHPDVDVNLTFLPANNDQLAAQVQSAFAAQEVPDLMMLYSGVYTTTYADGLMPLNDYVDATPGFYNSMSEWDLSCIDLDCKGGKGTIVGVPQDQYGFYLYYNKDLFAQAGISDPPKTYDELYAVCEKLKAKNIVPMVYGDRDGYTTSNMLTSNVVSTFEPGDLQKLLAGDMKWTDAKIVEPLAAIVKLHENGCVNEDASTHEQLDAGNLFASGQGAMTEGQPQFLPQYESALGDKLGIALLPVSGNGPWKAMESGGSGNDWVIPKGAKNADLAWELIKLMSDEVAGASLIPDLGSPPANLAAAAKIEDPYVLFVSKTASVSPLPPLDVAMPNSLALFWYRALQQAFAMQISPMEAMQQIQQQSLLDQP
jgi:ABC-type glycerol-3-phosphate transport system substrate-binding protein